MSRSAPNRVEPACRPLHRGRAALAAAALAGLAACATVAPADPERPLLSGRLSVQIDGDPPQRQTAGFELSGDASRGRLLLTTPIGTAVAEARWDATGATLTDAQGRTERHATLHALAEQALGEALPLAALFDWLRGRPWPRAPAGPRQGAGPGFEQLGWDVDLSRLAEDGLLVARRAAPPPVTVRVRLERP